MNGKVGGDMAAALLHDDKIPSVSKERLIRTKSRDVGRKSEMQTKYIYVIPEKGG